jgi:hypothetical protein
MGERNYVLAAISEGLAIIDKRYPLLTPAVCANTLKLRSTLN